MALLALSLSSIGQGFRETFSEANILYEDGFYSLSIRQYMKLLKDDPDNANLHYKLGRAYLDMGVSKEKALPHLQKAAKNIKKTYDPYAASFKSSPVETYFYLAHAYHLQEKLDSAEFYFDKFLEKASKKHYLKPEAAHQQEMVAVARELIASPVQVRISNIGKPINSEYAEYSPIIAFDENSMFFTSRRRRQDESNMADIDVTTGLHFEDIYVSNRSVHGEWLEPELININVPDQHSSVVSMSTDGMTLYIYKTYSVDGNIYVSDLEIGTGWSTPYLVGSNVNTESNEFYANLSYDRSVLYFVSDREGGYGGKDIYYVQRLPDGTWGDAMNAGPEINTEYDEDVPFFHPDDRTMYFASNGHRTMGGFDIFYAQLGEDSVWSEATNLGYPINTTDDDHSYIATPDGKRGYYASKAKGSLGMTDIFMVEYLEDIEAMPELDLTAFAVLKGWVIAPAGSIPDSFKISITDSASREPVGDARPVARNGSFVFIIPSNASYKVDYLLGSESLYTEDLRIPPGVTYQELSREIFLYPKGDGIAAIAIKDEVLGDVVRWKLSMDDPSKLLPLGSKVMYLDEEGNVIDSAQVSIDGYFEYKRLDDGRNYILKPMVVGIDNSSLRITLLDDADSVEKIEMINQEQLFMESSMVQLAENDSELPEPPSNNEVIDSPSEENQNIEEDVQQEEVTSEQSTDPEIMLPKRTYAPEDAFTFSFDYNQTTSESFESILGKLVARLKSEIAENDSVSIDLEASASTVPTSLPGGNYELSKQRLRSGRLALFEALDSGELDMNKISTKSENAIISGPDYFTDPSTPKSVFSDYQYFRVIIN